jgi:arylformamidase
MPHLLASLLLPLLMTATPELSFPVTAPFPEGKTRDNTPRPTPFTPPPENLAGLRVARGIAYVDEPERDPAGFHTLDITAPAEGADLPVLVFIHGGGWTRNPARPADQGRGGPYNAGFARTGIVFVSISYRLAPDVRHPALIEDCARAFVWIRRHIAAFGGSPERIFLTGHSAGAHLAALLALNPRFLAAVGETPSAIRGCIPISGNYWIAAETKGGRVFGTDPAVLRDASPGVHAGPWAPPFLVVCGDHYPWEPSLVLPSTRLVERLRAAGVAADFHQIADRDHETILTRLTSPRDPTTALILAFIAQHADTSPTPP